MIRLGSHLRLRHTRRRVTVLLIVLSLMMVGASSVWGKFGISKTRAVFVMYFPPAFHVPNREVRLHFISDTFGPQADLAQRMEQQVSQALTQERFRLNPTASTVLQGSLDEARASVDRERRPVSLNIRTGERIEKDKNGKEKKIEECKTQQVHATFLTSRGRLVLNLTVADAASRSTLFSHTIERSYLVESMVDGPRLCGNRTYSISPDHLRYRGEILALLADQAAAGTIRLATGYSEDREALLAVDNELKPGNSLALAGNWAHAQSAWEGADIPAGDNEKQAARAHNIGVAREVMAVLAMREDRLGEAEALLSDADKSYAEAISLDSGEKYFRDPVDRIKVAREVLEKMKEYRSLDQTAADDLVPPAPPDAAGSVEIPLNGFPKNEEQSVQDYRLYVRTRLEASLAEPDADFRKKLLSVATDYRVPDSAAAQVVESETRRLRVLIQAVEKYEEDYKAVVADGAITAAEREMLQTRQKTLHLPDALARAVEARYPLRM